MIPRGVAKAPSQKVATTDVAMDWAKFIYYLDADGDIARKKRDIGGKPPTPKPIPKARTVKNKPKNKSAKKPKKPSKKNKKK